MLPKDLSSPPLHVHKSSQTSSLLPPLCHEAGLTAHFLASHLFPSPCNLASGLPLPLQPGIVLRQGLGLPSLSAPPVPTCLPGSPALPRIRFISCTCPQPPPSAQLRLTASCSDSCPKSSLMLSVPSSPLTTCPQVSLTLTWHSLPLTPPMAPPARGVAELAHSCYSPQPCFGFCKECINSKGKIT